MSQPLGSFVPRPAQTGDQFQARFAIGRPLIVQVVSVDGARSVKDQVTGQTVSKKAVTIHVWDLAGGQVSVTDSGQPVHGAPNTVYCNVLWMAAAVVDNLEPYVGAPPMPMMVNSVKGKSGHNYLTPVALEGPMLQQVQAVFAQDPTRIDREAAAKAQAAAAQAAAPAYQQSGFQPMQVQPSAPAQQFVPASPQGQPANAYQHTNGQIAQQMPAPAAAQFQQAPNMLAQQFPAQPDMQQLPAAQGWAGGQQPPAATQFQAPPGQPGPIANTPAQVAQQYAPVNQAAQQGYQMPPQQAAPAQAQQSAQAGIGYVQNSDVANILAGLAGQQ